MYAYYKMRLEIEMCSDFGIGRRPNSRLRQISTEIFSAAVSCTNTDTWVANLGGVILKFGVHFLNLD